MPYAYAGPINIKPVEMPREHLLNKARTISEQLTIY